MNNETFGMTFQYAVCKKYGLESVMDIKRVDADLLVRIEEANILDTIFKDLTPVKYLTMSKEFTSEMIAKCPHNFLLDNGNTLSIKTFGSSNRFFAPKVVGQSGLEVLNHYFGHLYNETIDRDNFKIFCLEHINDILPVLIDYTLVSDVTLYVFLKNGKFEFDRIDRGEFPELTFEKSLFSFTKATEEVWNESNTVKYKGNTVLEIQLHKNRFYKFRFNYNNFRGLLKTDEKVIVNNSLLGDTAELAICKVFRLDANSNNERLLNNSDQETLDILVQHYEEEKEILFPLKPIAYCGTEKRGRGGNSKSGVDFKMEGDTTLSVKTNKSKAYKVCPPEVGQPSPKTFDLHFTNKGWYEGEMNETKFRSLVRDRDKLASLLNEYVKFLNECDYILWTQVIPKSPICSIMVKKEKLENIVFNPELISYSNDFTDKSSVTIRYKKENYSLGEFQIHSARNSLKFRFNFNTLISLD